MPLKVIKRHDRGNALTIVGTVAGQVIRRRAQSNDPKLAAEEAAILETEILRSAWHGDRLGYRSFAETVKSYLSVKDRAPGDKARIRRILVAVGPNARLIDMTQERIDQLQAELYPNAAPATVKRGLIMPIRAVLRHAQRRGWCHAPIFETPPEPQGRTAFMTPLEAERLILAAASHLKPLITFLIGTGARMSEALGLEWKDVDLQGQKATFHADQTKSGARRVVRLSSRVIVSLAHLPRLPERTGRVFLMPDGSPYETSRERGDNGGQIKRGWAGAVRRAGLPEELTPHVCRHTWASWHYAVHRDLLRLKVEGGWSSTELVERYAHLMNSGMEKAIETFLGTEEKRDVA
jgi:integrase